MQESNVVYENDNFYVSHNCFLCSFFVRNKYTHAPANDFGYSILTFPIFSLAYRAKKKAIAYADKLNELVKPVTKGER